MNDPVSNPMAEDETVLCAEQPWYGKPDPDIVVGSDILSEPETESEVANFYRGKTILITGATGFVGKVLVEKLLRCCPGITRIFALIRPKRKQSVRCRLNLLLDNVFFDRLRDEQPDFASKITAIPSDLLEDNLGLSNSDEAKILSSNVVFHCAASVNFNDPLKKALGSNCSSILKLMDLAKRMSNLNVLVHCSTAYSNCDRNHIEETVYKPPVDPYKLIETMEWLDDRSANAVTPSLLGKRPNTYTLTKALAEHIVVTEAGDDIPVAIVRPTIITSTWKEPMPGWNDSFNGLSGLVVASGTGLLRIVNVNKDLVTDIIPVDVVVNTLVTAAWEVASTRPDGFVYYCGTSSVRPLTWDRLREIVLPLLRRTYPLEKAVWYPKPYFEPESLMYTYWTLVSHRIPAYLFDAYLRLRGARPRMVRTYDKIHASSAALQLFTTREWRWSDSNSRRLQSALSPVDSRTFPIDVASLDWVQYLDDYTRGSKLYLMKEELSRLPQAHSHMKKLRRLHYLYNMFVAMVVWKIFLLRSSMARNIWQKVVNFVMKILWSLGVSWKLFMQLGF